MSENTTVTESKGVRLIAAERLRQIETEGWTPDHDAEHGDDALARAAACYALPRHWRDHYGLNPEPKPWPWDSSWWKPTPSDRMRELVKAGALIAAEIDRLTQDGAR